VSTPWPHTTPQSALTALDPLFSPAIPIIRKAKCYQGTHSGTHSIVRERIL